MSSISLTLGLRGRLLSGTQVTLQGTLFGNNEPGVTFEPWDITTLYQDRAGTTPVTAAGQWVGLRLDKSKGLRIGPELVTNGSFNTDTNWTKGVGWTIGSGVATHSAGTGSDLEQTGTVVAGKLYILTLDVVAVRAASTLYVMAGSLSTYQEIQTVVTTGSKTVRFIGPASGKLAIRLGGPADVDIDNISVRELAGNHEVAVSDAKRGVYGWMPKTGKRNLLTYSENFSNAAWAKGVATVAAFTTDPWQVGGQAYKLTATGASAQTLQDMTATSTSYTFFVALKKDAQDGASIRLRDMTTVTGLTVAASVISGPASVSGTNIVSVTNLSATEWSVVAISTTAMTIGNTLRAAIYPNTAATTLAGDEVVLGGAQLETGVVAHAYQRVVSQYDITEAGVPTCYYVQADGADDAYVTPTITPNTDKVQVFAGVRKLSDATTGTLISSGTTAGTIEVFAPINTSTTYQFRSFGSILSSASAGGTFLAPITNVITGLGDISGDTATLRVNGTQVAQSTTDQGTGNFLAYPAYIYGRGGALPQFNGLDFGHAVRFGPNLDAATIARVESLIARNTPEVTL